MHLIQQKPLITYLTCVFDVLEITTDRQTFLFSFDGLYLPLDPALTYNIQTNFTKLTIFDLWRQNTDFFHLQTAVDHTHFVALKRCDSNCQSEML